MLRLPFADSQLGNCQGLDAYEQHQAADMFLVNRCSGSCQAVHQRAASFPMMLRVEFVDPAHQLQIIASQTGCGTSVVGGTWQFQRLAATLNGHLGMLSGDYRLLLRLIKLSPGRFDKKRYQP
jgi:hypothetical protein